EPGDRRASSGGETRLLRCGYGDDADYATMARRAGTLWCELERESGEDLLVECGVAWFAHREDGWEAASERTLAAQGIPIERRGPRRVGGQDGVPRGGTAAPPRCGAVGRGDHGAGRALLPARPLPGARERAADRGALVPLRAHPGQALHRRTAPGPSQRVAGG